MKTKTIKQTAVFKASPLEVYEALMDSKKHAKLTGEPAKISQKEGGAFSTYSGYATGKNIKLTPGKIIVQEWRASDWPEKHYSEISFEFKKEGKNTKMTFVQKGIPAEKCEDIKKGWKDYYWEPMKKMLEDKK